jgi:UDP-N-acetyl-2-amino-2-deoxyglucuronate dehydrogenase
MDKIKFGIIGCGKIGTRHADFLISNPNAELVAVCDLMEERAKKVAEKGISTRHYTDYREMLDNNIFHIVNVCVPNGLHPQVSIDAMNSGFDVLVEKPLAITVEDGMKMINVARKRNRRLFVVKQNRHNKPIKILKDAINNGNFGKIYMIISNVLWNRRQDYYEEEPWRGTRNLDGGALLTQASHFIDMMQWIGGNVRSLYAHMENFSHDIEVEDTGSVLMKFDNGAIGSINYTTSVYNKNMEGSITVLGTKGTAKIGGEYLNKIEHWNVEGYPLPEESEETAPANDYGSYRGSASKHNEVFNEIINLLKNSRGTFVEAEEGLKTVEIIEAAKISAETGKEIQLPLKRLRREESLQENLPVPKSPTQEDLIKMQYELLSKLKSDSQDNSSSNSVSRYPYYK